jgi:hypothetical protein
MRSAPCSINDFVVPTIKFALTHSHFFFPDRQLPRPDIDVMYYIDPPVIECTSCRIKLCRYCLHSVNVTYTHHCHDVNESLHQLFGNALFFLPFTICGGVHTVCVFCSSGRFNGGDIFLRGVLQQVLTAFFGFLATNVYPFSGSCDAYLRAHFLGFVLPLRDERAFVIDVEALELL